MTVELLDDQTIEQRLSALRADGPGAQPPASAGGAAITRSSPASGGVTGAPTGTSSPVIPLPSYKYVRPLSDAADSFIDIVENPGVRVMTGLVELDVMTRGFGPGELVLVVGYVQGGKTQLLNTMVLNNPHRRIVYFSLDDPAEMILVKLLCMHSGIAADTLEKRLKEHDPAAHALMAAAETVFPNLLVVDVPLGFAGMLDAIAEATDVWGGQPPELVLIDYLALIPSAEGATGDAVNAVAGKAHELKRTFKPAPYPVVCVHQGSRSQGAPGKPVTIVSAAFGGDDVATMLLGARRKAEDVDADDAERRYHANTITLHVVKNKRPPAKKTPYAGVDFHMNPETGAIRSLREGDRLAAGGGHSPTAAQAARAVAADTPELRLLADTLGGVPVEDGGDQWRW